MIIHPYSISEIAVYFVYRMLDQLQKTGHWRID